MPRASATAWSGSTPPARRPTRAPTPSRLTAGWALSAHLVGEDLAALTAGWSTTRLEAGDAAERILGARCAARARPARRSRPAGQPCSCGRCRCCRPAYRSARSSWSATSPRSAAGTGQLMTKDATIREIHHRVKNNLQTVAALLRLQARRVGVPAARNALEESVRRVASIALVHETLSMSSRRGGRVRRDRRSGGLGRGRGRRRRDAGQAAPGGLVRDPAGRDRHPAGHGAQRTAAERGRARASNRAPRARSWSAWTRHRKQLQVTVADNGVGLPADFGLDDGERLGLQIVRTLARGNCAARSNCTVAQRVERRPRCSSRWPGNRLPDNSLNPIG